MGIKRGRKMKHRVATISDNDDDINELNQSPQLTPRFEIVLEEGQRVCVIFFVNFTQIRFKRLFFYLINFGTSLSLI